MYNVKIEDTDQTYLQRCIKKVKKKNVWVLFNDMNQSSTTLLKEESTWAKSYIQESTRVHKLLSLSCQTVAFLRKK